MAKSYARLWNEVERGREILARMLYLEPSSLGVTADSSLSEENLHGHRTRALKELSSLSLEFASKREVAGAILFTGFPSFLPEFEGIGFPYLFSRAFPNTTVICHFEKRSYKELFTLRDGKLIAEVSPGLRVNLAVGRGDMRKSLELAIQHGILLDGPTVNIKTMSMRAHQGFADFDFTELEMCPPPITPIGKFVAPENPPEKPLVILPGRVYPLKNQLGFARSIEPKTLDGCKLLVAGDVGRAPEYAEDLIASLSGKGIDFVLTGGISQEALRSTMAISEIGLVPQYLRKAKQREGYPRVLGEMWASGCLCIANSEVTVPWYQLSEVFRVDFSDRLHLNQVLAETRVLASRTRQSFGPRVRMDIEEFFRDVVFRISKISPQFSLD